MSITFAEIISANDQTAARAEHLDKLREIIGSAYPNKFERTSVSGAEDTISNLLAAESIQPITKEISEHIATLGEGEKPAPELKESLNVRLKSLGNVKISGRLTTTPRTMGKAAFVHLSDGVERLQIYFRRDDVRAVSNDDGAFVETENSGWEVFKLLDGGDFIGVGGFLFLTNTGELSIHVETIQFLAKALMPMPDKMHGINDPELQRRYRYADLIASSLQIEHEGLTTREVFERRARLISGMRRFLDDAGYIEVETPMLTPKATGAAAKPFATHHNALDIPLYARIAPELYLKRLLVGGFEKVYELNRNFRNEGLSQRHNPEFTMLEFYAAYMDVNGMMDFAEAMIKESVRRANNDSLILRYNDREVDFSKFERLTMKDAIGNILQKSEGCTLSSEMLDDPKIVFTLYSEMILAFGNPILTTDIEGEVQADIGDNLVLKKLSCINYSEKLETMHIYSESLEENETARLLLLIFESLCEKRLNQPTFITDYPKAISPLSKASPENSQVAERFELFINGMECANGFSELNDPQEQLERFLDQQQEREGGDEEAMVLDEDYIRALAYGMPPAAGIGIGIDRLVMLLTNRQSIRDVILFPHMRPENTQTNDADTEDEN